ncbi:NADPH:quinone reductase 2 [gamma proteobacterium HTCC5015]|nr:NADPH:quinone reductase 2 [gamma proteobacterium HTCC5015]
MAQTRQQVVIRRAGSPDVLAVQSSDLPALNSGEVTVEVAAAGVNFADILARQGLYPDAPPLPCTVGYEVAGTITAVADDRLEHRLGERVFGLTRFGGYASHINIPAEQLFEIPQNLNFEEAASLPVAYLTAWQLAVVMGQLRPDETLLIQNAGGGVGLALLDIAQHLGATTIGTASGRKHEFLKQRGLDHAIDYTQQDWLSAVLNITDQRGVELITDPLGGASWRKSYRALRSTGRLGMFGVSEGAGSGVAGKLRMLSTAIKMPFYHPVSLMNDNRAVFGVNMGHMWHEVDKISAWMKPLIEGIESGWVRPKVDAVFRFEQAGDAHQYIENRKNIGKVVLTP